jgi:putative peptidoglycan lipid II flippase
MLPYLAFAGPVAVMAAVLNANGRVGLTAFSPVLFNMVMITAVAVLLLANLPALQAALTLAAVVGVAGCFQLIFLGVSGSGYAKPTRLSLDREIQKLFRRALPGMVAQSGSQLFFLAGAMIASASPSAVAFLYFASRLVDLPLGLVGTATGAVLIPRLSGDTSGDISSSALQLTFGLALPASVGLALLAHPIVTLLFEHGAFTAADTQATARALVILAAALPAFALARPMSAVFFAREQMTQPLAATLAGLAATVLAGILAEPRYGYAGVAAAISLGAWATTLWLGAVLAARNELAIDATGWRNAAFIVVSSAIMGGAIEAAVKILPIADAGNALRHAIALGTLIALGILVYAISLRLFGVVNFRVIRRAF